jgi:hypothetical protein
VFVQLPQEIGAGYLLPYKEFRIFGMAREISFFEAITSIQGYGAKKLAGSVFATILCGDLEEALNRDHVSLIRDTPKMAAQYLNCCTSL